MRSTILVASVLAFASLVLGGCAADSQDPTTTSDEKNVTSGAGSSAIAEPKLRDGVTKDSALLGFDESTRKIATKDGVDRFDTKPIDGVVNPGAKTAEPKRDVIVGGNEGNVADTRRDVTGNGGYADGLADNRTDNVEQPADADMYDVTLDDAVQMNVNKDDIRRKARAAK
jgi:hypothetical protein